MLIWNNISQPRTIVTYPDLQQHYFPLHVPQVQQHLAHLRHLKSKKMRSISSISPETKRSTDSSRNPSTLLAGSTLTPSFTNYSVSCLFFCRLRCRTQNEKKVRAGSKRLVHDAVGDYYLHLHFPAPCRAPVHAQEEHPNLECRHNLRDCLGPKREAVQGWGRRDVPPPLLLFHRETRRHM